MDTLTASGEMTPAKRARLDYLLSATKLSKKHLKRANVLSREREMRAWQKYLRTGDVSEYRDTTFQAGTQAVVFQRRIDSEAFLCLRTMRRKK